MITDEYTDTADKMQQQAQRAAERGLEVFLIVGKTPPKGCPWKEVATSVPEDVAALFAQYPEATGYAAKCGQGSGVIVLDVDPRHGGDITLARWLGGDEQAEALATIEDPEERIHALIALIDAQGEEWRTATVITGSWGVHFYWKYDASFGLRNGALRDAKGNELGLDIKSEGGYVVGDGSVHPITGRTYEALPGREPSTSTVKPMPAGLVTSIKEHQRAHGKAEPGARIPHGVQENTLTSLAGSMRARGMTEAEILAALRVVSQERCNPQVPERNLERIAHSVCKLYDPDDPLISENTTDRGNARRFAHQNRGRALFSHSRRTWFVYTGSHWQEDDSGQVMQWAKLTAYLTSVAANGLPQTITDAQAREVSNPQRQELVRWALASEDGRRLRAMIELAQDELPVRMDELDADPWLFNVANGTIDLRTGKLRPHDPADLITKCSPVAYDPKAVSELWESFLSYATQADKEVINFLQLVAGASLAGVEVDQLIALVHGPGGSGKTTATEAIRAAMGDYAVTADFSVFLAKPVSSGATPEILRLAGARLVTSVEVDKGRSLASALVKQMTGGDAITGRALYARRNEDFVPVFTLWLVANDAPVIDQEDSGFWRRVVRIPFEHVVPEEERDATVKLRLKDPAIGGPAVLAWMVKGCLKWQSLGMRIPVPERVRVATKQYRAEQDGLSTFLNEACEIAQNAMVPIDMLADAYESYYLSYGRPNRERHLTKRQLTQALAERGFERDRRMYGEGRRKQQRVWLGIGLKISEDDSEEDADL